MNGILSFLKRMGVIPKKTKQEIIKELFDDHYCKHPNKRAIDSETAQCVYLDVTTGNRCAVGMCMLPSDDGFPVAFLSIIDGVFGLNDRLMIADLSLDDVLKEEYRGHGLDFWKDVQELHDNSWYWTLDGLTEEGSEKLSMVKKRYSNRFFAIFAS